ncbi:long-chain-fatty-acid--CoA ligase [Streptomyces lavendofoliae]|uniref:long-chain-fatty-acid--CoA ligase n=1 Tax=Streptomyces lavendofoliae TaxID=67314 RepID=UPI003D8CE447
MTGDATPGAAWLLADTAARRPGHPALVTAAGPVTYGDLWERARRYAAVLRGHGVRPGDRVALLLTNTPHFPAAYFGALALGATVVPVNALLKAGEAAHVLGDSGARALVCAVPLAAVGTAAAREAGVDTVLTVHGDGPAGAPDLDALAARTAPVDTYVPRAPDDLALILYTSGTTGRPKGAMITHHNLVMNVTTTVVSPFALSGDDVLLGCLPLFHTFGQVCGMAACFRAGATMVLMPRFEAAGALRLMTAERCTVFMGVPTMYLGLLEAARLDPGRPPLQRAYSGGAALPVAALEEFRSTFGCEVYEGYGLTETSPVVAYNRPGRPCRPGTVGTPIEGVRVAIARADVEDRVEPLPPGETGEIVVSGHNVMAGYLGRPEATAEVLVDGWFRTGDLGVQDEEGRLTVVDRKKDMVVRAGYNVYPREVEELLARHPAVAAVAVIGLPDDTFGEEVCAVVRPRPGAVADEALAAGIIAWSRARIAAYKYPRRVEFTDSFPLGPSGKVLKRELVSRYAHRPR